MWIRGDPYPNHCLLFLTKRFYVKIEEEELLRAELRKIEARKKEREKKTADLQKLIAQADSSAAEVSDLCSLLSLSALFSCLYLLFRGSDLVGSAHPDPESLLRIRISSFFLMGTHINLTKIHVKNGYYLLRYPEKYKINC
jgi:hypothetical protein